METRSQIKCLKRGYRKEKKRLRTKNNSFAYRTFLQYHHLLWVATCSEDSWCPTKLRLRTSVHLANNWLRQRRIQWLEQRQLTLSHDWEKCTKVNSIKIKLLFKVARTLTYTRVELSTPKVCHASKSILKGFHFKELIFRKHQMWRHVLEST